MKRLFPPFAIVTNKWSKAFITSHVLGWITATLQTIWIVYEVRMMLKKIMKDLDQQTHE
jgi:hypothetical protein